MARFVVNVKTENNSADVFAYLADVRNFVEWDPGVVSSVQVSGEGPELGAAYDVTVRTGRREMTLRYEIVEFEAPNRMKVVADAGWFRSVDEIQVSAEDDGTLAVYDAALKMPFPLSVGDFALQRVFDRIGSEAAVGLERALQGVLVS